ncbi:hypothetical protein CH373_05180 [Leptospira perolatii]|uniref:Uncharacterized protein n=1 Tax=Leptospira perolatii TaxID=2023191 RepID=A0A2M9ZQF5_9LEPT|nr:hypothetical protein [Leptospira perolatii]PJZ70466.1 hypothetical protein CH360_05600 [Leptospira perolatii]PJZ74302.1 hypothetical protein CH373_05180 [Leptospira perolatii]
MNGLSNKFFLKKHGARSISTKILLPLIALLFYGNCVMLLLSEKELVEKAKSDPGSANALIVALLGSSNPAVNVDLPTITFTPNPLSFSYFGSEFTYGYADYTVMIDSKTIPSTWTSKNLTFSVTIASSDPSICQIGPYQGESFSTSMTVNVAPPYSQFIVSIAVETFAQGLHTYQVYHAVSQSSDTSVLPLGTSLGSLAVQAQSN